MCVFGWETLYTLRYIKTCSKEDRLLNEIVDARCDWQQYSFPVRVKLAFFVGHCVGDSVARLCEWKRNQGSIKREPTVNKLLPEEKEKSGFMQFFFQNCFVALRPKINQLVFFRQSGSTASCGGWTTGHDEETHIPSPLFPESADVPVMPPCNSHILWCTASLHS